jgi:hypothetical protein
MAKFAEIRRFNNCTKQPRGVAASLKGVFDVFKIVLSKAILQIGIFKR